MLPLILDSTLCANNAQVDYYHYEVVLDACPKNHPWQISVRAAMFTMAAMVRIPPLFGLCSSFVTWLKKVAKGAVISYATFNFICVWGAWLRLVVFLEAPVKKTEDAWSLGQALSSPLGHRSWWSSYPSYVVKVGDEVGHASRFPIGFKEENVFSTSKKQMVSLAKQATAQQMTSETWPSGQFFRGQYAPII
ncbi:hypothetical protein CMEL01_08321 [Colletotrichum melonis]|uniref:Uncharacterized protein n=1 Tax=Colletotrichum melonis TaxID=1209925 RepID=A0AAI9TZS6_9PEZI|nr:hypothetical protein CMEL01_08321 [Colletotrichum melonis]